MSTRPRPLAGRQPSTLRKWTTNHQMSNQARAAADGHSYWGRSWGTAPAERQAESLAWLRFLRLGKDSPNSPTQGTTHHKGVWKCFVAY